MYLSGYLRAFLKFSAVRLIFYLSGQAQQMMCQNKIKRELLYFLLLLFHMLNWWCIRFSKFNNINQGPFSSNYQSENQAGTGTTWFIPTAILQTCKSGEKSTQKTMTDAFLAFASLPLRPHGSPSEWLTGTGLQGWGRSRSEVTGLGRT